MASRSDVQMWSQGQLGEARRTWNSIFAQTYCPFQTTNCSWFWTPRSCLPTFCCSTEHSELQCPTPAALGQHPWIASVRHVHVVIHVEVAQASADEGRTISVASGDVSKLLEPDTHEGELWGHVCAVRGVFRSL